MLAPSLCRGCSLCHHAMFYKGNRVVLSAFQKRLAPYVFLEDDSLSRLSFTFVRGRSWPLFGCCSGPRHRCGTPFAKRRGADNGRAVDRSLPGAIMLARLRGACPMHAHVARPAPALAAELPLCGSTRSRALGTLNALAVLARSTMPAWAVANHGCFGGGPRGSKRSAVPVPLSRLDAPSRPNN